MLDFNYFFVYYCRKDDIPTYRNYLPRRWDKIGYRKMASRERHFVIGEIYHIFTKSIAGFKIFNSDSEFLRMLDVIRYYQRQREKPPISFSEINGTEKNSARSWKNIISISEVEKLVEIVAYCLMPTHLHLILKQTKEYGISNFMNNILNSYTRYFNIKHNRKGPLWEGRFKSVLVESDEQLLHLTRYIHLNPVTAYLVNNPLDWRNSSYREYLLTDISKNKICRYEDIVDINPTKYRKFVENLISYQRELVKIKKIILD